MEIIDRVVVRVQEERCLAKLSELRAEGYCQIGSGNGMIIMGKYKT